MSRRRPSPATALAIVALLVALGGTGYAASGGNSSSPASHSPRQRYIVERGRQGPRGLPGLQGVTGSRGSVGPAGSHGVLGAQGLAGEPGDARAYGLVIPPCWGCGELPEHFTPLIAAQSKNVTLASPKEIYGKPFGTWCFGLEGGIDASTATVVTSAISTEDTRGSPVSAEWEPYARDCSKGQIEIKTFVSTIKEGKVVEEPEQVGESGPVSFSFVVLSTESPAFAGLQSASYCTGGPVQPAEMVSYTLTWQAATDNVTPSSQIVYDIFVAHPPGGEDFSHPTWTTPPGVTTYSTPDLPSEGTYFVVRARDKAGNEDQNTVEREGVNTCF
jgi:Collagen triple helix repeat (20 copies)